MYRPEIVIRDIHRYGDDLTVPEATARLCDGGPVTLTVTDPAPPGGDPRGNPRHGFDITVSPALGRQPELPPEISWEARSFETPDGAALFSEALVLASQLAACAGPAGGQSALSRAAAVGSARGQDAARRALATPEDCRDITARFDAGDPITGYLLGAPALAGTLDLARCFGLNLADGPVLAAVEDAFFTAAAEALFAEAERIPRDRAARHPARRGMNPGRAKAPDTATLIGKTRQKEQTPVTEYKLNRFTMADAQALAGKTADITAWDDDELETKVTYPGAKITGIIVLTGPYLVIETAGAVITDARTGERLGTRPPEPELHVLFTWVCEVDGVRGRFMRGDRVALEHTDDPHTRLRPGDEGTVTRYAPGRGPVGKGQLDVSWDSGSTLSMLLDDGDRVRLLAPAPGEAGKEPGR